MALGRKLKKTLSSSQAAVGDQTHRIAATTNASNLLDILNAQRTKMHTNADTSNGSLSSIKAEKDGGTGEGKRARKKL